MINRHVRHAGVLGAEPYRTWIDTTGIEGVDLRKHDPERADMIAYFQNVYGALIPVEAALWIDEFAGSEMTAGHRRQSHPC